MMEDKRKRLTYGHPRSLWYNHNSNLLIHSLAPLLSHKGPPGFMPKGTVLNSGWKLLKIPGR